MEKWTSSEDDDIHGGSLSGPRRGHGGRNYKYYQVSIITAIKLVQNSTSESEVERTTLKTKISLQSREW
jgi:hypothetical protein